MTRYSHGVRRLARIEVVEAAHPVPDAAGQGAARRMLDLVQGLQPDDLVLCLISGGASSLPAMPARGMDLAAKQAVNRALLRSGAGIGEMNCVRKHLSAIKGGRLAQAASPAQVVTLMISDVPGDDPSVIGSGPTIPDDMTLDEARVMAGIARQVAAHGQPASAPWVPSSVRSTARPLAELAIKGGERRCFAARATSEPVAWEAVAVVIGLP